MPLSGLQSLGAVVGLPCLDGQTARGGFPGRDNPHFEDFFTHRVTLQRHLLSTHSTMLTSFTSGVASLFAETPFASPPSGDAGRDVLRQLNLQLDQWQVMPRNPMRWHDHGSPSLSVSAGFEPVFAPTQLPQTRPHYELSTEEHGDFAAAGNDIITNTLRTQYLYIKSLVHRPFVFEALHQPQLVTPDDAAGVIKCVKSCLKWPITTRIPRSHRNLVPMPYFWTRNIFGALVLLHMSQHHPVLAQIIRTPCFDEQLQVDIHQTVNLYLEWLHDLKKDPVAQGYWNVARVLFSRDG
jgi:hypothetical protein